MTDPVTIEIEHPPPGLLRRCSPVPGGVVLTDQIVDDAGELCFLVARPSEDNVHLEPLCDLALDLSELTGCHHVRDWARTAGVRLGWTAGREDEARALRWAVGRIQKGLPVRRVLGEWFEPRPGCWSRKGVSASSAAWDSYEASGHTGIGWWLDLSDGWPEGPETGDAGKAAADRAAMDAGYWLDGGPFVPEVTDG